MNGTVEIQRADGVWGTVQDASEEGWSYEDATVVCRMLDIPAGAPNVFDYYTAEGLDVPAVSVPVLIKSI